MFDIASGRELHSFSLGAGMIPSVEFDAKGKYVVASLSTGGLKAVKIATGDVSVIDPDVGWIARIRFSPDGRFMAAGGAAGITIWDARTWKELRRIGDGAAEGSRSFVGFSRDSRHLAAIDMRGRIQFWDPATGAETCAVGEGLKPNGHLEFTQDGRVLAAGMDGKNIHVFGPKGSGMTRPGGGK